MSRDSKEYIHEGGYAAVDARIHEMHLIDMAKLAAE